MNKIKKALQCLKYRAVVLGEVGENNHFDKGTRIESTTQIGNNNYFSFRVMCGNSHIGNYCSFGPDVKIGQSQHSINYYTTSQMISSRCIHYSLLKQPTIINNDVWIGSNAVIMQGVNVGNGAVIGANAVVTKDVPEYAVVAGIPARVIRYRLTESVREKLKSEKWWELNTDEVCNLFHKMQMED